MPASHYTFARYQTGRVLATAAVTLEVRMTKPKMHKCNGVKVNGLVPEVPLWTWALRSLGS